VRNGSSMENSLPDDRQVLFVMSAVFSFVVFGVLTFLHVFQRVASARLEPGGLA
jgi:hypothetical protein